ncbi:hypothetical protein [Streptomyces doebereineriae]|uniref:Uncharacterized protein n=1 Tax=Streptomyces doebereineriae TaxID=3075528 RepID=A0ABU2VKC1_9ACTN|nr:hypothetical protein [Streptomyces sp. DSM 41640]MDT0485352.1 hypothetical protein [Streptomyces sp. DSM 41640]
MRASAVGAPGIRYDAAPPEDGQHCPDWHNDLDLVDTALAAVDAIVFTVRRDFPRRHILEPARP